MTTNPFLATLIPETNRIEAALQNASNATATTIMEAIYSPGSGFIGVFIDEEGQPDWARRAARYLDDEFMSPTMSNVPAKTKLFGDVIPKIKGDGEGEVLTNFRHALDFWTANDRQGVEPYAARQRYGSCVDASCGEHENTLFGVRAKNPENREIWKYSSAWWKYAFRGYCSDGWNGSGIASVAYRVGAAFRIPYDIDGNKTDFTDNNQNEYLVAREWCRRQPDWLKDYLQQNHPYEDGAITRFQGGVTELRKAMAAGGVIHTSGTRTSGGSKPFSIGSVGPHMQSAVGCDDSDEFRKFCKDTIGVTPRDNDFPVIMMQTWGPGWRGECADQYWPSWWGIKPEGAWVWWASDVVNRLSCDYVWLPWVKGFPGDPTPPPPASAPEIKGEVYGEEYGDGYVIRGTLKLEGPIEIKDGQKFTYAMTPTGDDKFKAVWVPDLG
jgi:hypothetical protein